VARRRRGWTARANPFLRGFTNSPWTGESRTLLNLITAKVLDVTFPLTLLGRADEVIE
jgi:hypothetical protein